VAAAGKVTPRPLPKVTVGPVTEKVDSIAFHVSRTGVPVVVKTSFFPNWKAHGADGPWRLAPNLMVVIPTSHDVRLTYGETTGDRAGRVLTLAGVLGAVALARIRPVPEPVAVDPPADPPGEPGDSVPPEAPEAAVEGTIDDDHEGGDQGPDQGQEVGEPGDPREPDEVPALP
jgi:hypothetical protein